MIEGISKRSQALIEQYSDLHKKKEYGRSSEFQLGYVQRALMEFGKPVNSILDFGCGQSRLVDWLAKLHDAKGYRYDPAIPEYKNPGVDSVDIVVNNDVLEHVPEEDLSVVLGQMRRYSENCFIVVDCYPAGTTLKNGENAHCTVQKPEWWKAKVGEHFSHVRMFKNHSGGKKATLVTWPIAK